MNTAEEIIARLIDSKFITGEEAIILIKSISNSFNNIYYSKLTPTESDKPWAFKHTDVLSSSIFGLDSAKNCITLTNKE